MVLEEEGMHLSITLYEESSQYLEEEEDECTGVVIFYLYWVKMKVDTRFPCIYN
jgi:hypothetical protein